MHKSIDQWPIYQLADFFPQISFPEYQREPNLWPLPEKQRLIDSIARDFDIASLYFYEHSDGSVDCVDGRQRIGAIMSFLGGNSEDEHNNFRLRVSNEIYNDPEDLSFKSFEGKSYSEIDKDRETNEAAAKFLDSLLNYPLSIVRLSDSRRPEEFNLQFTRLNLGTIINAGEKLHAMIGDMRDECFGERRLGSHSFLSSTNIPTRRFAREQVAAQILLQVFSLEEKKGFVRARHFDLQRFFRIHSELNNEERELIRRVKVLLDLLEEPFRRLRVLRNRAIVVSTVILAWQEEIESSDQANLLAEFIEEFQARLTWQVRLGLDSHEEYRYLLEFQRHVNQASAEKPAFTARANVLSEHFHQWQQNKELSGDREWEEKHGHDPKAISRIAR